MGCAGIPDLGVKHMINMTEKTAGNATEKAAKAESRSQKARKESKPLRRHFKYIVPQYRLILVKEPGIKPTHISDPIFFHHCAASAHCSEEHLLLSILTRNTR
jgi:hypothetical protein